jgi:RNA polymerase sigma factor (sigma-70 family)
MTENEPYRLWMERDERAVVAEMLRDPGSKHWEECSAFVKKRVYAKVTDLPNHYRDEITQEVSLKVSRSLPTFKFQCAFKNWLTVIIENCITDMRRKLRKEKNTVALGNPFTEDEHDSVAFPVSEARAVEKTKSAEEAFIINEDLRRAFELMEEYVNAHANAIRNRQIIRMVIEEGHTHEETAKAVGCNPPVVSYVVRVVQKYVREGMKHEQP